MGCIQRLRQGPTLSMDQGYAWVILVLSFIAHTMHVGFNYGIIGAVTLAHQHYFSISLSYSSIISSIHLGVFFCTAPLSSILVKKIGCRWTMISGGTLIISSLGASYFSTKPWHAVLLFGLTCAMGISNSYIASTEALSLYFNKYKYFAFSAAVMGYYVGVSVWPIVSQHLLTKYGYSKAMALFSIPHISHIIGGLLFYEPSQTSIEDASLKLDNSLHQDSESQGDESQKMCEGIEETTPSKDSVEICAADDGEFHKLCDEENKNSFSTSNDKITEESNMMILDGGAKLADSQHIPVNATKSRLSLKQQFVSLLRDPKIWALLLNAFFWAGNITSYYVLVNDFVVRRNGLSEQEAASGVTITGVGNLVGCASVVAASRLSFDRVTLHFCTVLLIATSTIATAFSNGKVMFYLLAAVWGYAVGACNGNLVSFINAFCTADKLVLLFALHLFSESITAISSPPLLVYLSGLTTDQWGIIFGGMFGIGSCLCVLPVIIYNARRKKPQQQT